MERSTHFFFAVSLPEEVKKELHKQCLSIQEKFLFRRWVHQEDYHMTLAFLGEASGDKLEKAKRLVMTELDGQQAFPLQINQLGFFGQKDSPRIFWANTAEEERLNTIRDIVFSACLEAGFKLETRPFKSHITLARKWAGSHPFEMDYLKDTNPFAKAPLIFQAKEVVLYQTHIDRVPKYEKIAAFSLLENE